MLAVEGQLSDSFANDLLKGVEKTVIKDDLRVLWLINQVGLDEQVANGIHSHKVDRVLQLVDELEDANNRASLVEQVEWH